MVNANLTAKTGIRFAPAQLVVIDLLPLNGSKEALADFFNRPIPGTTLELLNMASTTSGNEDGCHLVVLRDELTSWQAAAKAHDLRLQVTNEPVRLGAWDGGATIETEGAHVVITFPE